MPDVLTIGEVSTLLGLTDRDHRAVRGLVRRGLLAPLPGLTRPLRFSRAAVEAYLGGQRPEPAKARERRPAKGRPEWLRGVVNLFPKKGAKA